MKVYCEAIIILFSISVHSGVLVFTVVHAVHRVFVHAKKIFEEPHHPVSAYKLNRIYILAENPLYLEEALFLSLIFEPNTSCYLFLMDDSAGFLFEKQKYFLILTKLLIYYFYLNTRDDEPQNALE